MSHSNSSFSIPIAVRDYECDMQGIVNNSVYGNYFEHARHEYLKSLGLNFAVLTAENIHLVVTRIEIDYRAPLKSGDIVQVTATPKLTGQVRGQFIQKIIRRPDNALNQEGAIDFARDGYIAEAVVHWASITPGGRPIKVQRLHDLFTVERSS